MTSLLVLGLLLASGSDLNSEEPVRSGWRVTRLKDKVVLTVRASHGLNRLHPDGLGPERVPPYLVLGCDPDKKVWASVSGFVVGIEERNPVTLPLSLDGGPPVEVGAVGVGAVVDFDQPKAFIRRLLGHQLLSVGVRAYPERESQDIRFDLDGLDKAIGVLFEACGWNPIKKSEGEEPKDSQ